MKKLVAVMAMALCSVVMTCGREDTKEAAVWRTVEPRLTRATNWQPYVRSAGNRPPGVCDKEVVSREDALDAIALRPQCIGEAIKRLQELTPADPRAKSDLAAAYYVRAEIENDEKYLLDAWQWVQGLDNVPEAQFNLALIQEKLGHADDAERSWDKYQKGDPSPWGIEAHRRSETLRKKLLHAAFDEWPKNRRQLTAALDARDRTRVIGLIRAYQAPAETYLEDELIPQWAASGAGKDLERAQLLADAVSEVQQDPFARDVVAAITKARDRSTLRKAHIAYAEARRAERAFDREATVEHYRTAIALLTRGHSPLRYAAELELATNLQLLLKGHPETMVQRVQREVRPDVYPHTAARVAATLAYIQNDSGNHIEALAEYGKATTGFRRSGDSEYVTAMQSAISGVYLELGDKERAWREAVETNEHALQIADVRRRHVRLGALSQAARELGYPDVALRYQNEAVEAMQQEMSSEPPQNLDVLEGLRHHLSIALRGRAEVKLAINPENAESALADLREAYSLIKTDVPKNKKEVQNRKDLTARIYAVEGAQRLIADPEGAIASFSEAITLLPQNEQLNLRATFLTQRAKAFRALGRPNEAESDLTDALLALHREETIQLAKRKSGKEEEIWSFYFDRFQDTYRQLIELLVAKGDHEKAFEYAERAKAFEPLDLVLKLPYAPPRFRELTQGQKPITLKNIQNTLPEDTYLLEYSVLGDSTIVWIIGHGFYKWLPLPVGREEIRNWRAEIEDAVAESDERRLKSALMPPYAALLREAWSAIPKKSGEPPRVVIVPDAEMRGLPFNALRNTARGYFVEDAIVSVDGSATLYVFSLLRDQELQKGRASALLIGDPEFDTSLPEANDLRRLVDAQGEVSKIGDIYETGAIVLIDKSATIPDFLHLAPVSDVIHIAAHGVVNEVHPYRSPILLAKSATDSGKLDAQALAGLRLPRTRLVVLASCSSAGGAPVGSEGVAPLVRPFIGAGVPAVVGSLWEFADATAKRLLVSFHQHYREQGGDAAKALRTAQLEALDEKKSLLMWAPFVVIGYASSPIEAPAAETKEKKPPP